MHQLKSYFQDFSSRWRNICFLGLFYIRLYWSIVALQYCTRFRCRVLGFSIFTDYTPLKVIIMAIIPCAMQYFLLLICFFFNLRIVASRCCGNFCCTAEWISCTHARIPSVSDFLPIYFGHHRALSRVSCAAH